MGLLMLQVMLPWFRYILGKWNSHLLWISLFTFWIWRISLITFCIKYIVAVVLNTFNVGPLIKERTGPHFGGPVAPYTARPKWYYGTTAIPRFSFPCFLFYNSFCWSFCCRFVPWMLTIWVNLVPFSGVWYVTGGVDCCVISLLQSPQNTFYRGKHFD